MPLDVLDLVIQNALTGTRNRPLFFIWQGGEPTLAGLAFFQHAIASQKKYAAEDRVYNALQTNGLLIDGSWVDFLVENRFLVGLSLDGPKEIHDTCRYTRNGGGTWVKAREAAQRLHKAGAMLNALCCITRFSEDHAKELYYFFKEEGFHYLQCIPVWETDSQGRPLPFSASPEGYGRFLVELFDVWKADTDGERLSIRQFDSLAAVLAGNPAPECGLLHTCGVYLTVEHDGSVYPCDFFVHPAHSLGNASQSELSALLNSNKQRLFGSAKARVPKTCLACKWRELCNGGCLKYRAFSIDQAHNKSSASPEYVYCSSMCAFFAHALPFAPNSSLEQFCTVTPFDQALLSSQAACPEAPAYIQAAKNPCAWKWK